ncbi:hypothetical protein ABEB36_013988 [Hypothenemus hampei]|uniref:Uncharacterized protein n=1 Tax=Hypothenemus hampei TaxID=57062 RepID=A0ABD1E382_HYPHA
MVRLKLNLEEFFHVSQSVISRLLTRFQQTGNFAERLRIGRPKKTTAAQDHLVRISARRDPLSTCRQLSGNLADDTGVQVSIETIHMKVTRLVLMVRLGEVLTVPEGEFDGEDVDEDEEGEDDDEEEFLRGSCDR